MAKSEAVDKFLDLLPMYASFLKSKLHPITITDSNLKILRTPISRL